MKVHKRIQGMTLLEVIIAMLLLSILMMSVAFSGTSVLLAVKNRTENVSKYALAMNKAQALVVSKGESFANSATFSISNSTITYYEATPSNNYEATPSTINFQKELEEIGLGDENTITVSVARVTNDPNAVEVHLKMEDAQGRVYENSVFLRKLLDAAPLLPKDFAAQCKNDLTNNQTCSVALMFPALGFLDSPDNTVTATGYRQTNEAWQPISFTYMLADNTTLNGITVYKNLKISTSATATILLPIVPPMVGIDGTITASAAVKVGG